MADVSPDQQLPWLMCLIRHTSKQSALLSSKGMHTLLSHLM